VTLQACWSVRLLLCLSLAAASLPARAAAFDFLFGKKADTVNAPLPASNRRSWPIGQFTSVELVAREPEGPDNRHPAEWPPELLRRQLGAVRASTVDGPAPLFAADELDTLVVPLSQALALAKPTDDVLLLSSHRRGGPFFIAPMGITARLFVSDDGLQLIVHDARLDYYNTYIGSRVEPTFTFGSRSKAGGAVLQSAGVTNRRADWLSLSATVVAAPGSAEVPGRAPGVAAPAVAPIAAPVVPPITAPVAAPVAEAAKPRPPAAPAPAAAPRPRDPGFADDIEQRLLTLKRLFDRGLITEAEYQQKRKEVLQSL
jgi:Short C-terminal domain